MGLQGLSCKYFEPRLTGIISKDPKPVVLFGYRTKIAAGIHYTTGPIRIEVFNSFKNLL
jgi:hypothetical protein